MRLVHQEHEVIELGQILEVALADVLAEALDPRSLVAAHLAIDLRYVENVDVDRARVEHPALDAVIVAHADTALVVVAGDDLGRVRGELGDTLEDVLGRVGREVSNQLVIDREVRGEHEKVADLFGSEQVRDERAHEPGFADAGGEREAERRKVALEVGDAREFGADHVESLSQVGVLFRFHDLAHAIEDFERVALRLAQTEPVGNGVDVGIHRGSSPKRDGVGLDRRCLPERPGASGGRSGSAGWESGRFLISRL